MILRVPGGALLLRVAWIERRDSGQNKPETPFCPKMVLVKLSHFQSVEVWARKLSSRCVPWIVWGGQWECSDDWSKDSNPS